MKNFNITFEITEQELLKDVEVLSQLKNEFPKVRFAIDDFGTGYSSLRLVANLAENKILHILKIDKSLILNLPEKMFTQKVVRAISLLSKSLGIKTVAEFVEDEETWNIVRELNVDYTQGFFISKPETIEELLIAKLEKV
jgi:EAL domain-containing protein (putative c-di-GMP-specific phosphodiesterase class I)